VKIKIMDHLLPSHADFFFDAIRLSFPGSASFNDPVADAEPPIAAATHADLASISASSVTLLLVIPHAGNVHAGLRQAHWAATIPSLKFRRNVIIARDDHAGTSNALNNRTQGCC
jgi:hypothetical protein